MLIAHEVRSKSMDPLVGQNRLASALGNVVFGQSERHVVRVAFPLDQELEFPVV